MAKKGTSKKSARKRHRRSTHYSKYFRGSSSKKEAGPAANP